LDVTPITVSPYDPRWEEWWRRWKRGEDLKTLGGPSEGVRGKMGERMRGKRRGERRKKGGGGGGRR